jgi:hypothetical protein
MRRPSLALKRKVGSALYVVLVLAVVGVGALWVRRCNATQRNDQAPTLQYNTTATMVGNPTHAHPPAITLRPPELLAVDEQRHRDAEAMFGVRIPSSGTRIV